MRKNALCAIAMSGLAVPALALPSHAADFDLPAMIKDPIPENLTWNGFTFYGAIDLGTQYLTHGAPVPASMYTPPSMITPMGRTPMFGLAFSQEELSNFGIKTQQSIGFNTSFVANAQMTFNPTSGELSDALKTLQAANGVPLNQQGFQVEGARAGQLFSGVLYAGLDNSTLGRLTFGRHLDLIGENLANYDPLFSYGTSYLAFAGLAPGPVSSETPFADSSIRYSNDFGIFHVAGLYGHPDTDEKEVWQVSAGLTYKGLSFDAMGGHASDQVSASALSAASIAADPAGAQSLGAKVYDTDMYALFAKYKLDLGGGSYRSDSEWQPSVTFSGAYEHVVQMNPADGGYQAGHTTAGGYVLGPVVTLSGSAAAGIVNNGFTGGNANYDIFLAGVKYEFAPQWKVALDVQDIRRSGFGYGLGEAGASGYSAVPCSSSAFANCAGSVEMISARLNYQWTKRVDVYIAAAYSTVRDGMRAGYLHGDNFDPTIGIRYAF